MSNRDYTHNAEESEKALERYLCEVTKAHGGLALKYFNPNATGYPDRILLFPDGEVLWVELKSKGKHPTALQSERIRRLRDDFRQQVYICDSREKADKIVGEREMRRRQREKAAEGRAKIPEEVKTARNRAVAEAKRRKKAGL